MRKQASRRAGRQDRQSRQASEQAGAHTQKADKYETHTGKKAGRHAQGISRSQASKQGRRQAGK
eukprot:7242534-Alexandrium_andersonii.AAC.1